ncbi:hypothetical protein OUZ56_017175 [Daphnia magna]|uniref:Uncharacterized protein n=1 Tax=Daphnia magna TaxID=35525 RepID=A0ABR0ASB2_9CRUS|nr:hypothetical protein OUZ56_017175 [Daphnia magna]
MVQKYELIISQCSHIEFKRRTPMWVSPDEGGWGETGQARLRDQRLLAQSGCLRFMISGKS